LTTGLRTLAATALLLAPLFLVAPPAEAYSTRTGVLHSFDGTPIVFTHFLPVGASAANPVPVVLRTHGWGGARETTPSSTSLALLNAGYSVVTWDARGFGESGGSTELDSPDYEVKDTIALLDAISLLPQIQKDAIGAKAAMSGVSYAGGIQLLTSAYDPRIRAIAPEITWNDLRYALAPNGVVKNQWVQLLFWDGAATTAANGLGVHGDPTNPAGLSFRQGAAGTQTGAYDTNLPTYYAEVMATNGATPDVDAALAYRSPSTHAAALTAPTLLIQGWPDSLFTVNDAARNFAAVTANGAPAKLALYCGGHAGCPYNATGERDYLNSLIVSWFDAHVKGDVVDTGPTVEYFTSENVLKSSATWPIPATMVEAHNYGNLVATPVPTSGAIAPQASSAHPSDDGSGKTRYRLPIPVPDGAEITGIPMLTIALHAGTTALTRDATIFARLVDVTSNTIVDGVSTPIRFDDNEEITLEMTGVSYTMPAGHALALELTPNDIAFSASRFPGLLDFEVTVDVPVVA
jgi:ABC-2 type transport system ATP-binding protein